jgi:outer membrane protein TolC
MLLLVCLAWPLAADSWDDVYTERLEGTYSWRQARLQLAQAELAYTQVTKPYLPTITVGTSGQTSIGIQNGQFSGAAFRSDLVFSGLLGADLSLQAPLSFTKDGEFKLGSPALIVSRKLFVETTANRLSAQASLLRTRNTLREAELAVRTQLVSDVFNAVYSSRLLAANQRSLTMLERDLAATVEATARRELERRILQAQRSILSTSSALANIDERIKANADILYEQLMTRIQDWIPAIPASNPLTSASIQSQEYSLAAAEKRRDWSFLPYVPNPTFSANLSYNPDKSELNWGMGLSFSLTVLDKGERDLAALQRQENAVLEQLQLDSARKSLTDTVNQARDRLKTLELDRQIKSYDVADKTEAATRLQALYNGGFTSAEKLLSGQIDAAIAELDAMKIEQDILLQKLRLAQYFLTELP